MPEPLNVFDHQYFRLRSPSGEPVKKTLRQLLTEPDAPYALDYAQAFYDVAALGLLAFLTQLAFEPEDSDRLAQQLSAPMSPQAFDAAVNPFKARCALTGDGPRFMQAPGPFDENKAKPVDLGVFIAATGDRQFLNRADSEWAVSPAQAGLFLFARNTFYEGTGGRGYQKGTNGDTPIRTLVTDPAGGDAVWLRRTVWLNVLSRQQQRQYPGDYAMSDHLRRDEYGDLFWATPPASDVPTGGITLGAGLGWMTAFHWLWYEEGQGICPLTGEHVKGTVARYASKKSSGIAYGSKGDIDTGTRADRLFRHPNVPTKKRVDRKSGDVIGEVPFLVHRTMGLADAVGAAFFGGRSEQDPAAFVLAPAVDQVQAPAIKRWFMQTARQPNVLVFGFHMLSNQRNVHGGIEMNRLTLPLLGESPLETKRLMETASHLMRDAGSFADQAARALGQAVQRTAGAGVRAEETEDGRIRLKKLESTPSVEDPFGSDTLAAFWRAVQRHLVDQSGAIVEMAADGPDVLTARADALRTRWEDLVIREVRHHYRPVFEHYSTLSRTMPYAHAAKRLLGASLKKLCSTTPPAAPQPETV